MTVPQINTLEYLRTALLDEQNSAVVTQNADGTLTINLDIGPGAHLVDLLPLQGPTGAPGLPQFPLMLMPDILTDPKDLPFDLTNTDADIGKYFIIDQFDATGCINSSAYIWFGTEYRVLPFGVQGPPGTYGVIKPYVTLLGPNHTSHMTWAGGGTVADPYLLTMDLSVPTGPSGESCPLFDMPDVRHDVPPESGQLLAYNGDSVTVGGDTLPVWSATSTGDIIPQPFLVPASAFKSYSHIDFSAPVSIVTFSVPPMPFPWKPLVWGQVEMFGTDWFEILPDQIGAIIVLGDPDPEVGELVARGFGNAARGVVTIIPHCSYPEDPGGPGEPSGVPGSPSIAMTPGNSVGAVPANHTGQEGTLHCILVNEGKRFGSNSRFDFSAAGSGLFILACPMTDQSQLSPPLNAGFTVRTKFIGLVSGETPPPTPHPLSWSHNAAQVKLPNPGSKTYPILPVIRRVKKI